MVLVHQFNQMKQMGGMAALMDKLPGMSQIPQHLKDKVNDKQFVHMVALIDSMTKQERRFPNIIKGSRKGRICRGAGLQPQNLNQLLKQFEKMQKMMKKILF